ncbi:Zinc finger protein JACKDAW [Linum perenne]
MMSSGAGDPFSLTLPHLFIPNEHEPTHLPNPFPPPPAANPNPNPPPTTAANNNRKKRNLPGTPDPDAEVMALSPKSLMATNRFLCEICNKGFQRDQNLQLHRRGHNLPWKLKQRNKLEPLRKKVYICPEKTCVHHDPSRALGDLTGIKKHFSRKHGEKKWKCDKCSKKYAVLSDWKAHSKTCGTREYKCDCGTLFSRKDSFITHRAFCDALADDSLRFSTAATTNLNFRNEEISNTQSDNNLTQLPRNHHRTQQAFHNEDINSQFGNFINPNSMMMMMPSNTSYLTDEMVQNIARSSGAATASSLSLSGMKEEALPSLFSDQMSENKHQQSNGRPSPMSATALLQKAAQIGSTRSTSANNNNGGPVINTTQPSPLFGGSAANSYGLMPPASAANSFGRSTATDSFEQLMMGGNSVNNNSNNHHHYQNLNRNINYSSDSMESRLTRDFLGMSGAGGGRAFLQEELARFATMSSSSSSMGFGSSTTSAAANPL